MRTGFELKTTASSYAEALSESRSIVAGFLGISEDELDDKVSLELKIQFPKAETAAEIAKTVDDSIFVVTIFGTLKQGIVKPFGQ